MTREQVLEICRRAPTVGTVTHEEFADYVVPLQQRKKIDDEWTSVQVPYMAVDGKLAMANEDHRRQGKRLDFGAPQVLVDNSEQLTLLVTVTSEVYGTRHGIATSRRIGGTEAEREFPWEVAETSAIGRALSAMGYGLFPGSGLSSAEDMLRVTNRNQKPHKPESRAPKADPGGEAEPNGQAVQEESSRETVADRKQGTLQAGPRDGAGSEAAPASRPRAPLSTVQRRKLVELYRNLHGGAEADAARSLDALFVEAFKHGIGDASYEEGARITTTARGTARTVERARVRFARRGAG
jgi:hypothetical protein